MKKLQLVLTASAVVLMAAGCGGGGSLPAASGGAAAVSITSSNAAAVAKGAMSPSQAAVKTGSSGASVVGVVVQTGAPRASVMDIALAQLKLVQEMKAPAAPAVPVGASVSAPVIYGCGAYANTSSLLANLNSTNGTMTKDFQGTTSNNVTTITAVSLVYSNCVEPNTQATGATTTLNGTMTLTFNSTNGVTTASAATPLIESVGMTFGTTVASFTSVDTIPNSPTNTLIMNGSMTLDINDNGTTLQAAMSGASFSMSSNIDGAFTMKNFKIDATQDSPTCSNNNPAPTTACVGNYNFSVAMTTNLVNAAAGVNGDVVISTPTRFAGTGTGDPASGIMKVNGNNGSYLTIVANTNKSVTVSVNDGTAAAQPVSSQTLTWAQI